MVQDGTIELDHDDPDDAGVDARAAERARDAELVRAAVGGDDRAFGELYDLWFDRVFNLTRRILRDDDTAAEVAQDAFLSAWRSLAKLDDANAFGGWLLRIARNAAYNRSDREARSRPVDDRTMAVIEGSGSSPSNAPSGFGIETRLAREEDPQTAVADGEVALLVRETVDSLGERDAEVLDLQLRYGMTPAEIGEVIGVNRNAANQLCHRVRARFATAFGARMLWNGSRPACDKLDALLRSAGIDAFGAEAVKVADKHAKTCDTCDERRELRLQPSALFAALPLIAAPTLLKAKAASALAAEGVPMSGSASIVGSPAGGHGTASGGDGSGAPNPPGLDGSSDGSSTAGAGNASGVTGGGSLPPTSASTAGPDDASDTTDEDDSTSKKRGTLLAVAVVVLLLLLGGFLVARSGDDAEDVALVGDGSAEEVTPGTSTGRSGSSDSSLDVTDSSAVDPSGDTSDSSVDLGTPADPNPGDGDPTGDPSGDPTQPGDPDPGPPAPLASLDMSFTGTQKNHAYFMANAPVLEWATGDAVEVRVWEWIDGVPNRIISSELSNSGMKLCPGQRVAQRCVIEGTTQMEVSYVIEAVNADGVVTSSDTTNRPGFTVLPAPQ